VWYCNHCGAWLDNYLGKDPFEHMCLARARALVRQIFAFTGIRWVDAAARTKIINEGNETDKRILRVAERVTEKRRGER
jgi:hypothetical protein